jgi:glycerophosphoryl diester phosphodiesterase
MCSGFESAPGNIGLPVNELSTGGGKNVPVIVIALAALAMLTASAGCDIQSDPIESTPHKQTVQQIPPGQSDGSMPTPIVIAHRGASGQRPEHTLAAYQAALVQGADFIELDLVATRDGSLIARHENLLAEVQLDDQNQVAFAADGEPLVAWATTNVAEVDEFASRLTVKRIDGRFKGGWFSEDFTLAELKTLRARERMPSLRPQNRLYDDQLEIPTLAEVVDLIRSQSINPGVGLYIELKHPTYFRHEGQFLDGKAINIDLGGRLLETLSALDFMDPQRLYIQSFEVASLIALRADLDARQQPIPLVQLYGDIANTRYRAQPYDMVYHAGREDNLERLYGSLGEVIKGGINTQTSYAELSSTAVLTFMAARYASGVGPPKSNVLLVRMADSRDPDGDGRALQQAELTGERSVFVEAVLSAGLELHPYTLRSEEPFLVRDGDRVLPVAQEAVRLLDAGATGFFIDQPAEGRIAVAQFKNNRSQSPREGDGH